MMRHLMLAVACLGLALPAGQAKAVTFGSDYIKQFNFWNSTSETITIQLGSTLVDALDQSYTRTQVSGRYVIAMGDPGLWQQSWVGLQSDSYLYGIGASSFTSYGSTGTYEDDDRFTLLSVDSIDLLPGCTLCLAGYSNDLLQYDSVPLMTIDGKQLNVQFWSGGGNQYVNLIGGNGFSITENTKLQNNAVGNGFEVQLGGAGGNLTNYNICFQIGYSTSTALNSAEDGFTGWTPQAEIIKSTGRVFAEEVTWKKDSQEILEERIEGKELGCVNNLKVVASSRKGKAAAVTKLFHVFVKRYDGFLHYTIVDPKDLEKWGYVLPMTAAPEAKYNAYLKALEKGTAREDVNWHKVDGYHVALHDIAHDVAAKLP